MLYNYEAVWYTGAAIMYGDRDLAWPRLLRVIALELVDLQGRGVNLYWHGDKSWTRGRSLCNFLF